MAACAWLDALVWPGERLTFAEFAARAGFVQMGSVEGYVASIYALLARTGTLPAAEASAWIAAWILPIIIGNIMNVPFQFGGTSLLIVVGVALDTMAQMQQHLLLRKYDGFMKKGRVRFRGRGSATGGGGGGGLGF